MRLVKLFSVFVALAGLAIVVLVAAPSVYGHSSSGGSRSEPQQRDSDQPRRSRELRILAGRGVEIGASVRDLSERDKEHAGVVVDDVRPGSPAERAGLERGDIIVEFDGEAVRSARQFTRLVQETATGRTVTATVVRAGARKNIQITPAEGQERTLIDGDRLRERLGDAWRMYERMPPLNFDFDFDLPFAFEQRGRLGVSVQELTPQLAAYFGVKDGLLVTAVADDQPAARAGIKAGDIITKINDRAVHSPQDLVRELRDLTDDGQARVSVVRDKKEMTIVVKMEARGAARAGRPV